MKPFKNLVYRFGAFELRPEERLLLSDGKRVQLSGKAFDLLVTLVRQPGHLVTKDELLRAVWPGLVVEEVNLSVNVSALRKALGAAPSGEWIETVPRQGYRFNSAVEAVDSATTEPAEAAPAVISFPFDAPALSERAPVHRRRAAVLLCGGLGAAAAVGAVGWKWLAPRSTTRYASVAVLPFASQALENVDVADGIVEAVIERLTREPTLRVLPRASAFRFRSENGDPILAGRALQTSAVVTGTLSRTDDTYRLAVELVDVNRKAQIWSRAYQAGLLELPRLEARLTQDLADVLLNRQRRAFVPASERAPDPAAYRVYLQGRYLWNQRSEASLGRAMDRFRQAIEIDPAFALAHAALADTYTTLGFLSYIAPVSAFPVARPYALKALELDPSLAQAHASLAYVQFYFDWDWAGAQESFERAIALNPNDPVSHQWYAVYLMAAGRDRRAYTEVQAAHQLDPLSLAINTDIGFHHYYSGRYPEAVSQLRSVLAMKSDFLLAHLWLARALLEQGQFAAAIAQTMQAEVQAPAWSVLVAARGFTYGRAGNARAAHAVLEEMRGLAKRRFVTAYGVALVHTGLGQVDEAFRWLDRAFDERSHWLVWLRLDPRFKNLQHDPRFATLVSRMKYPS